MVGHLELLNPGTHAALRMCALPNEHPPFVAITLHEFPAAAALCPIFLAKDQETGSFYAGALFGFRPGEVLIEGAESGKAPFRPLELQRQGFFISDADIAVDVSHPRFGPAATIALFEPSGEPSDAMRAVQRALGQLKAGMESMQAFIAELLRLKLIEPIDINLRFDDGQPLQLEGLYTVSRDALMDLDDAEVLKLFRSGYLQAAHCMTLSLNQVAVLAQRRNARL